MADAEVESGDTGVTGVTGDTGKSTSWSRGMSECGRTLNRHIRYIIIDFLSGVSTSISVINTNTELHHSYNVLSCLSRKGQLFYL